MEKCGIIGYYSNIPNNDFIKYSIDSLYRLQHRGREGSGISWIDGNITTFKGNGLVADVYKGFNTNISTNSVIGHNRYSTSGSISSGDNLQPLITSFFSLVHNGNIIDYKSSNGKSDSQYITELLMMGINNNNSYNDNISILEQNLIKFVKGIEGVYCIIIQTKTSLYLLRDRYGVRPFFYSISESGYYTISSESVGFIERTIKTNIVSPGEIIRIDSRGLNRLYLYGNSKNYFCLFELIYFMDYNSQYKGEPVYNIRFKLGSKLSEIEDIDFNKENSIIIGSPNSGIPGGQGYSFMSKIKYKQWVKKETGLGRTFILPDNNERKEKIKKGFKVDERIADMDIILIDDSIVRGNTMKGLIEKMRKYNPKSIHVRIVSPQINNPCKMGIDLPTKEELVTYNRDIESIREFIGVDTLRYISLDVVYETVGDKLCTKICPCFVKKDIEW